MRKKQVLVATLLLSLLQVLHAQNTVLIYKTNADVDEYPISAIDTFKDTKTEHLMTFSYPESEGTVSFSSVISENEVNLSIADKPQSFNLLRSISFLKDNNSGKISNDLTVTIDNTSSVIVSLPYITDFSNLKMNFETTGSYVFLNGSRIKSGASCDFSKKAVLKVVAFNGDVRTYNIQIKNSGLPVLNLTTTETLMSDWVSTSFSLSSYTGSNLLSQTIEVKGRGSHYKEGLKNSYNMKFESEVSILSMPAAKRWVLLANANDNSMIRSSFAFDVADQFFDFDWIPMSKPVELVINGVYVGSYLLVEQIKVCNDRIENSRVISVENAVEKGDDSFIAAYSKYIFTMKDPETGSNGTWLVRTEDFINKFELLLSNGSDYKSYIDLNSFSDWYVLNELLGNEEAFWSDTYMYITDNNILKMGPIWDMSKTMNNELGEDYSIKYLSNSLWYKELLSDSGFMTLVSQRVKSLYSNKAKILQLLDDRAEELSYSVPGNESVWHEFGCSEYDFETVNTSYKSEVEALKSWLSSRLDWLNTNF